MTVPNIFTIIRLALILPILFFLLTQNNYIALIFILIAWITDLLDGYLARKLNQVSALGKMLDPIADKLLVSVIVLSLTISQAIPLYLGIAIIGRDVVILIAGLFAWLKYKHLMQSNWIGKLSAFFIGCFLIIILFYHNKVSFVFLYYIILFVVVISFILYSNYYVKTIKSLK